jgi:hypothetical protein
MNRTFVLLSFLLTLASCKKDNDAVGRSTGDRSSHLELSVDSACVKAPNFFTPENQDGINDVFTVVPYNVVDLQISIVSDEGDTLYTSHDLNNMWDGTGSVGPGPFQVFVTATTTSGILLQGQAPLYLLTYNGPCLFIPTPPVGGDQLDPRICGVPHASNDIFCP